MIVTRDRAEGFTLCAFAAARRAKKKKGLVFHAKPAYTANGTAPASTVIPTEPDVSSWQEFCAALTHNDVAGHNRLAAEFFHTQPFADAVAPVFNAALSFFMSH